jgi:integrase
LASTGSPHTRFATRAHRFSSRRASHGGGGKNVKQVQEWLGHHSAAYTLKEYVHLIDTGVGEAAFLDDATAA